MRSLYRTALKKGVEYLKYLLRKQSLILIRCADTREMSAGLLNVIITRHAYILRHGYAPGFKLIYERDRHIVICTYYRLRKLFALAEEEVRRL